MTIPLERVHPFQLTDARLTGGLLEFQYRLAGPTARVTAARLLTPRMNLPVSPVAPGLLQAALPAEGGRLTLQVDAAEGLAPDAPALPWQVHVHLPPEALSDYAAAEPLGALAELSDGLTICADRVRHLPDGVLLYWEASVEGSGHRWDGELDGTLLAGSKQLAPVTYPYACHNGKALRPAPAGQAASTMDIRVRAVRFYGETGKEPLVWQIHHGRVQAPGSWSVSFAVPPGRPAALAPDLPLQLGSLRAQLAEAWLARSHTILLFQGGSANLDLFWGLQIQDELGRAYRQHSSNSGEGLFEVHLEPIPPGVTRLTVMGQNIAMHLGAPVQIPLEPGGQGRPIEMFAGFPTGGWGATRHIYSTENVVALEVPSEPEHAPDHAPDPEPPSASALQPLRDWLHARRLPALRIQCEPSPRASLSPYGSHLAGPPFWPVGTPWPICGQCDQPLTFIGQIRLDAGGAPRHDQAELLTFHYCWECLPYGPDQASAYRLQIHRHVTDTPVETAPPPTGMEPVPSWISFTTVSSAPHWEDARGDLAGLDLGDSPWEAYRKEWEAVTEAPNMESRLGGYPDWIQGSEWPTCRRCQARMAMLWQLDSEAGLMWGDTGRVYIFGCSGTCSGPELALIMQCC